MKLNFQYELNEDQQKQWARFWEKCQHSYPRQHFLYADVERGKSRIPIFVSGEIDGSIECMGIFSIRPLFLGNRFSLEAYCLRGPAFDDVSVFETYIDLVIKQFKTLRVGSVRISPYWQFPEADNVVSLMKKLGFLPYYKHEGSRTSTGLVDLRRNKDEIFASLARSARKGIRKAEKMGLEIHSVTNLDDAMEAFRCLNVMRHKRGLTPKPLGEFAAIFKHILKNQQRGILFKAFLRKQFLGTIWIMRGPHTANGDGYAIDTGACEKVARTLNVGYPLWWQAILWAKEKGCPWLDVEGYCENVSKSSPVYHIHEFKRKYRPQPIQIISEHIYICCPFTYAIYRCHNFIRRGMKFARSLPHQLRTRVFSQRDSGG